MSDAWIRDNIFLGYSEDGTSDRASFTTEGEANDFSSDDREDESPSVTSEDVDEIVDWCFGDDDEGATSDDGHDSDDEVASDEDHESDDADSIDGMDEDEPEEDIIVSPPRLAMVWGTPVPRRPQFCSLCPVDLAGHYLHVYSQKHFGLPQDFGRFLLSSLPGKVTAVDHYETRGAPFFAHGVSGNIWTRMWKASLRTGESAANFELHKVCGECYRTLTVDHEAPHDR